MQVLNMGGATLGLEIPSEIFGTKKFMKWPRPFFFGGFGQMSSFLVSESPYLFS